MDSHSFIRRGVPALAACAALLAAAPAQAKTPLPEAEDKALEALGVEGGSSSVLVFREKQPLKAGTVVRQAGPDRPARTKANKRGVRRTTAPVALRVPGDEPAWFFYSDQGPFQAYQHPGKVVLVGVESGDVKVSETLQWPPVIGGKLPAFMRSAQAYRDPANRIFYRYYDAAGVESSGRRSGRASSRSLTDDEFAAASQSADELALRQRAADQLAEEHSCVVRFGETLGNFYDFASLSQTVVGFGGLFNGLEKLNRGFRSSRYGLRSGLSPLAYVQRAIDRGGCRDVLLYLAGSGYKGREVVNFGLRPRKGGKVDVQELSARQLRRFMRRNADVTFKLIADAPYAGDFADLVESEPNARIVQTPGGAAQPSFRFVPGILNDGQILRNLGNSMGLLEFTNRLRIGFDRFLSCKGELDHFDAQPGVVQQSFLVWALGRAFQVSEGDDFAKKIGLTDPLSVVKLGYESSAPAGCDPPPGDVNDPPVATAQSVNAVEDTPRSITLSGTDPDGDALGFEIVTSPAHGVLSGTPPNVTYTPAANYNGPDSFTFRVGDGALTSGPATVSIDVAAANDGPVVTTSPGSLAFTENGAASAVDPGLSVTDIDSTLASASVKVADGHVAAEDELAMPSQPGITGTYNSGTGVLTLTGSASPAAYQTALRSVTFRNSGDDPTASRRLDFSVNDGAFNSPVASKNVAITPVNDLPVVDATNAVLPYVEGDGPIPVDPALAVTDLDDGQLSGATVQITGNHLEAEDELAFTNASGITGAYDDASGKLTLTGAAALADYQAALRTVTYENASANPSTLTRTITFTATDAAGGTSAAETRDINVASVNSLATVATSPGAANFTEDGPGVAIDNGLTVADDDPQLQGATVAIATNRQPGDELVFTNQGGITGNYNLGSGILTLTGGASQANYEAALRSVEFDSPEQDPSSPKTIQFRVNDGDGPGPLATRNVAVTPVNDNPRLVATGAALAYAEDAGAVPVDSGITLGDDDSTQIAGATVQITSNLAAGQDALAFVDTATITGAYNSATGTLTLTGTDTLTNYRAALRTVTYENSSDDPSTATRTVSFRVDDGEGANNLSNIATRNIGVTASNDAPVVNTTGGSSTFTEDGAAEVIDGALTVSDADDTSLESALVRISSGFGAGDELVFVDQSGITGTYNSGTGVLTLTGTASVSDYQAALRSIEFDSTDQQLTTSRTVEFTVNDGDAGSNAPTKTVGVSPVNDAPTVNTTGTALTYLEDAGPVAVDTGLTASDVDSATLVGATVQITGNFVSTEDELAFVDAGGITGQYNSATGTLTLTGTDTVANYQAALRSVTYENTETVAPSTATRTVSFQVDDGAAANNLSNVATRNIDVSPANDAPVVAPSPGATSYTEGNAGTVIDASLLVTDEDDANLESAQVRISSGFESGDDLTFVNTANISGVYNTGTGVLTLTGTDTVANYRDALRSITFDNTSDDDLNATKTVEFKVNDGDVDSNLATKNLAITPVNDAPTLNTTAAALSYTEGDGAVAVDSGLTASDPDSTQFQGATVQVTGNFVQADDELAFTDQNGISGAYNDSTGTLTLSGNASLADYQTALRSVTYENVSDNPSGSKTVSFQATDAEGAASNVATRDINLTGANDAPVVTTSAGSTSYTEGDPGTVVDGGLTVSDADDTNLESGQVRISANFESGDDLIFVDQNGITGNYNSGTGVLTLSGTASVSDYQTALRSVEYQHTGDNPSTGKVVEFKVNDGDVDSNAATKSINLTGVNDAPTLTTTAAALSYTEGDGAVAVDTGLTVSDADSTQFQGATVQITGNFVQANDELAFTDQNGISGAYNDSTGTLTLSGNASLADYQTALRSVTYENVSDNPSGSKTVSFQATDAEGAASNVATRDINLTGANDAPVVTTSGGSTAYTEGDPATAVDGALTVSDADDTNLESGQVRISANFESGDDLVFVDQNGISGVYNSGTGVLTLTGTSSVANYQTALRSIEYQHTGDNPATSKTVEFKVNDGDVDSNAATKSLSITRVNDAPTLNTTAAALSYTEGDGAMAVDNGLTASDPDSTQFQGATVQITGNFVQADDELAFVDTATITGAYNDTTGTLTLSGTDTVANYQAALRSVTYESASNNPSGSKTVSFQATDAEGAASNVATRDINLTGANDAPVVTTSAGSTSYTEGDPATTVDGSLLVTDVDDTNLESGQVRISANFQSGDDLVFVNQNGISGVYNSGTGVLTLTGTSSVANYQTALRSIQFQTTSDNPSSSKTVEFKVNDGDVDSNLATKNLAITPVNDAPTLNTTAAALSYTEGDGAVAVDSGLTASDPDSTQFQGATVQVTGNFVQANDELAFVDTANITGAYNDTTGTLTLSGNDTVANYQAALRSVTYENVSDNPSGSKTVSFQATDAEGAASNVATRDINLTGANDAPVVTTSAGDTAYTEGDPATTVDGALTVTDADDTNLESGQVRISANFQSGDDLVFVNQNGISGVYNSGTGVLTLTGTSSVANYQTALRSIQYQTTNDNPSSSKTVEFKVNDGDVDSNAATKNVAITPVNDAPTVNTSAGTTAFVEDTSGPVDVDSALTLSDPDSANLSGATVSITTNFDSSEDELEFVNQNGITGAYNSGTGVLTLSGSASVADYQTALRSVEYDNNDTVAPSTATRTVSFQVTDSSAAASNTATKDVSVASVNDAPVITTSAGSTPYTEDDPATTIDGSLTVSDQDDTNLEGGQVRISSGFQSGDDLVFVNQNGISGVYNSGTGVLTLTGTSSVANYQTALQSIQFQSTNQQPVTSKTIEFKVNDGDVDSNLATKEIAVTPTNDGPIVTSGGTLSYTENDPATAVHSGLTIDDLENDNLSGGSASITSNYQAGQDFLNWTDNNLGDNITLDNINSDQQTIVLTGLDTEANYQAALRAVTYQNGSENPSTLNRTVTFSATDQPGLTGSDTRTIAITAVDDPPTAVNDSATVLEDAAATSIPVLTNDTDADGGPKTISNASDPTNGTVVMTGGSPGAHTGLTYQPDPNYCNDPPGTTPDTFNYTLNGGSTAMVSMTVTCVNDAPVADDETFNGNDSAHGNTTMQVDDPDDNKSAPTNPHTEISGDILAGDTDIDGPGPLTVTPGTFPTNDGGSVTLESDGDFVFQPAPTTSCTDTSDFFDYTVEDSGSPEQTDTGRVTIAIAGCVWYVKNNAPTGPGNNDGSSDTPFVTLSQAETASGTNHTVFVFDGDNTTSGYDAGGYAMNSGERLIGEHEGLTVDPDQGGALNADSLHPANAGAHPTLTSTGAGLDVIDLDDGNEIRGFNIDPQTGHGGIQGSSGDTGGGTIDDVNIVEGFGSNGTQAGLELNATTGTFNVTNFTVNNDATGVLLNNAGTVDFGGDSGVITLDSTGAPALSATSTNMGTSNFDDIIASSSTTGGVILSSASGTTNLGDGSNTDLSLTTSSGPTPALSIANSGTVTVGSGGTDELHATGGPALDVTGTSGASFDFEDVDSTNSANDGINIDGLGTGIFQAAAGDIGGAAGISFDLNGGSGTILYQGNLNNGGGTTAIDITGRSGGGVTLSGPISDTNDAGGALNLSSNTGGSTSLTNGTKQFNTGATNGVSFTSSDGHTLNLTGGGLDIDTTSGNGLNADTAGTIEVGGSGNTIDSTALGASNRGLNISTTDIAAGDVTFQRISTSGGTNGIRLNTTANSAGRLFVQGNAGTCTSAGTCTGGAIQSPTGAGVELTSVPGGASLTRVAVTSGGDDGIRATTVGTTGGTGLDLANSFLSANGNAVGERGLDADNVIGTSSITSSTITQSAEDNARWENDNGTLGLTVTGSTFSSNSAVNGADGMLLRGDATATMTANITTSTFQHNRDDGFQAAMASPNTAQMNVTFTGNDVIQGVNNAPNNAAMHISNGSAGDIKFKMDDNDLSGSLGSALILNPGPDGTSASSFDAIVTNNRIGTGTVDSGSVSGIGLWGRAAGNGVNRFEIRNNTIQHYQQQGMYLRGNEGVGQITDYTVTGNTVSNPDGTSFRILLEAGSSAGDSTDVCVDFGGAAALRNTVTSGGSPADIGVARDFATPTLTLRDYGGGDLSTYFNSRNIGTPGALTAILSNLAPAGNAAACALPTTPPLP